MPQRVKDPAYLFGISGLIPALCSGLRTQRCRSCGVGHKARILSLAQKLPYAVSVAEKGEKKRTKIYVYNHQYQYESEHEFLVISPVLIHYHMDPSNLLLWFISNFPLCQ